MLTEIAVLDELLAAHASALGGDLIPYRNHTYRVINLCAAFAPQGDVDKIAVAAALHDMGIWTAGTFDYLPPSIDLARDYLARTGKGAWIDEVVEMIRQHHKIRPYDERPDWLVEPFRRADWADVTFGAIGGAPRGMVRKLYARWPDAGFHALLARLSLRRLVSHPLNPLPMFKF